MQKEVMLEIYKKEKVKEITLPSGLQITVRELTPHNLLAVEKKLDINPLSETIYSQELIEELFKELFIEPKIPDDIQVADLKRVDYIYLHNLIMDGVTLPPEIEVKEEEN